MHCSGFLSQGPDGNSSTNDETCVNGNDSPKKEVVTSRFIRCLNDLYVLVQFVRSYLQSQLISAADFLHDVRATLFFAHNVVQAKWC